METVDRKFCLWVDATGQQGGVVSLEKSLSDMGLSESTWDAMTDRDKGAFLKEQAFMSVHNWGFREVAEAGSQMVQERATISEGDCEKDAKIARLEAQVRALKLAIRDYSYALSETTSAYLREH